jgi:hypothetical protein
VIDAITERWSDVGSKTRATIAVLGIAGLYLLLYKVVPGTDTFLTDKAPHEPIVVGIIYGTVNALLAIAA